MDKLSANKILKSEKTKYRIIDTYLDLMYHKNWDKISVKEICSNANITRGTFYQYFNDIYDLLEQIENPLISNLSNLYEKNHNDNSFSSSIISFDENFDCTPPKSLIIWFEFCKNNQKSVKALLSDYGDPYFRTKIKKILTNEINIMMNNDNMPKDDLRLHFVNVFLELHFLAIKTWLDSSTEKFLSVDDIIQVIHTMRVGSKYLSSKNNNV